MGVLVLAVLVLLQTRLRIEGILNTLMQLMRIGVGLCIFLVFLTKSGVSVVTVMVFSALLVILRVGKKKVRSYRYFNYTNM